VQAALRRPPRRSGSSLSSLACAGLLHDHDGV
jgi:hypothetical protein